jgi:tetratricopeptide (TPR) repeat protein
MRLHHAVFGLVAIAVLIAGYILVPRREEQVTMLARDGLYEQAAHELMSMRDEGDMRPHILMQLHVLGEKQGDHGGALKALQAYVVAQPDDLTAREKLAALLLQAGRLDEHLDLLAEIARLNPTSELLARLLALYRLHGRFPEERALLQHMIDTRLLERSHVVRLGALLAQRGEWEIAVRALLLAEESAPKEESEGRLLLFDALLQGGRVDEACQWAQDWLTAWRSPYLAGKLIARIARADAPARAAELARSTVDLMPGATFDIVGVLTEKGHIDIAREMLTRWADSAVYPRPEHLRDYVYASIKTGDARAPFLLLARMTNSGANPSQQIRLAEEIAHGFGKRALAPIRSMLSVQALRSRPLFGAELAEFEGNAQLARWFLHQTDPASLDAEQQLRWLGMLQQVDGRTAVFAHMLRLWGERRLSPLLLRKLADQARELGQPGVHDAIWDSMRR